MSREKTKLGKRRVSFKIKDAHHDLAITIPCGKCIGCMLERARQWSVRLVHESKFHRENSFVTLTYNDENLPRVAENGAPTLRGRDLTLFMKRLRKAREGERIRFFSCGEYGGLGRPHYHLLLFGCSFPDKQSHSVGARGDTVYRSAELEKLWPLGFSLIGSVTQESAAYVARYCLKKVSEVSDTADSSSSRSDRGSFRRNGSEKEFVRMSRRPGIGRAWFEKYYKDVYPEDKLVLLDGGVVRPPRYYDDLYKEKNEKKFRQIKRRRLDKVVRSEQSSGRLIAKRINAERRVKDFLKRSIG